MKPIIRNEELYQRIKDTREGKHLSDALYPIKAFTLTDIHRVYDTKVSRDTFKAIIDKFFEIAYDKVILSKTVVDMGVFGVLRAKKQKNDVFVIRDMFKNFRKLGGKSYSHNHIKKRGGYYPYFTWMPSKLKGFLKDRYYIHFGMVQRMRLMYYFFDKGYDFPVGNSSKVYRLLEHIRLVEKYENLRKDRIRKRLNL